MVDRLDSAPRFWISACRNACSEAVALPLVASLVADVLVVEAAPPLEVPVVAGVVELEPALPDVVPAVVDVELVALDAGGVRALTSAWKSCCSFATALSPEVDVEGFDRL